MLSPLHTTRLKYHPKLPQVLLDHTLATLSPHEEKTSSVRDAKALEEHFPAYFGQPILSIKQGKKKSLFQPKRVGVVLSGGQAPGGHNVIGGLFDALKQLHEESVLLGFLGGPSGIIENQAKEITAHLLSHYRNLGGFDIIGSGRTKIETKAQLESSLKTANTLNLDGLVVIGGDDSNTNAAILAEYFHKAGSKTAIVGVPKTIDGDLKNEQIEISFGHDTACRVYSEMVGNLMRDCLSAKKYYHFVKLMGRSASHITLECALQTHPTVALIGEEIAAKKKTLRQIVYELTDIIIRRSEAGSHYGVILIPEGLIEFIPEMGDLISQLNDLLASDPSGDVKGQLKGEGLKAFESLPEKIQNQLLLDRDPHGNVQVSRIETEALLMELCANELKGRIKFSPLAHFFGYEGRSALPTNFDAQYCYALGHSAALLINGEASGYMSRIFNLDKPVEKWGAGGIPITMLMNMERRHGKDKPVIQKALVDLEGAPFKEFVRARDNWAKEDLFRYPGPIQFFGNPSVTDSLPITLMLEKKGK